MSRHVLRVEGFAQIREASIAFGDLTVLVGAQGTGKSLLLQWLKASLDGKHIVRALRDAGQEATARTLVDLIFGVGMGPAWTEHSAVSFDGKPITPHSIERRGNGAEHLFFIPAHRSMLISDGWATPFQKLTAETPVVARLFSQNLFERFNARDGARLFPLDRTLKKVYRELVELRRPAGVPVVEPDHVSAPSGEAVAEAAVPREHLRAEPGDQHDRWVGRVAERLVLEGDVASNNCLWHQSPFRCASGT